MSTHSVFKKTGSSPRPFYWKTHPIVSWRILGRHTGRFTGKLIQKKHLVENNISPILGRHTGRFTGKLIQTIFQSFFNFLNLFKLRQKKPLFLEEKQVNDET